MRKIILILVATLSCSVYAQEEDVDLNEINNRKHEFRIDALEGLAVPALDIAYEYVLSKYSGFGANVFLTLSDDGYEELQKFAINGYYRQYLFNKKEYGARGFFAEGSLQYGTGKNYEDYLYDDIDGSLVSRSRGNWNKIGIGFAIGQKWVSRNGFVIELLGGGGRYFGSDDDGPGGFFRGGVNVGYRF